MNTIPLYEGHQVEEFVAEPSCEPELYVIIAWRAGAQRWAVPSQCASHYFSRLVAIADARRLSPVWTHVRIYRLGDAATAAQP